MAVKNRAPAGGTADARESSQQRNGRSIARARIIVVIDADPAERHSPSELRARAREAWREAVMRAHAAGRIETAIAEELVRAWPPAEVRT